MAVLGMCTHFQRRPTATASPPCKRTADHAHDTTPDPESLTVKRGRTEPMQSIDGSGRRSDIVRLLSQTLRDLGLPLVKII